jgi:hypothetical protein
MEEAVWSVIYFMLTGLVGTGYGIYYIMRMAYLEMRDGESTSGHSSPSNEG